MSQSHRERALSRVADLAGLIATLRSATQLRDGVFVAIEDSIPPILLAEIVTADGPIGRLVADAVVEVHVFDTSSIDIYSTHQSVLDRVRFGSTLRDDLGGD